ncbi:hypothetical protein [Amycolatopsis jiangsuensis]|uniref:Uncharacterized protein n=1 Tax=Amycolatopsis jiangsuensis TaxID=1181879 RepID=A0A840IQ33_9PSEU|nr:hypothetical protein [Amycolatopsis jiangsuensis]MBB4683302.1 hypothetical protein [Amycolatopsis jiangsuensis]
MSLTSELADPAGQLSRWCARVFTGSGSVARRVEEAVHGLQPVRPALARPPRQHWAEVGGAFGQRVADLVQAAPPYYALLGMLRAQWGSGAWAHAQAATYPTHAGLPADYRARALNVRPAATTWLDLGDGFPDIEPIPGAPGLWADFLTRARRYQARHVPPGMLGEPGAEAGTARTAWVLSACEDIYRSGRIEPRLARIVDGGGTVEQLRALPGEEVVTELTGLARLLHERGVLWELRRRAEVPPEGTQLGIAGPTIVPGWADGDLLLGRIDPENGIGDGTATLIDVKTVVTVRDPARVTRWLWQILLYAWLDTGDLYRIREVGLLLARHGNLVCWPVDELAGELLGSEAVVEHRRDEFRVLARTILDRVGLSLPES